MAELHDDVVAALAQRVKENTTVLAAALDRLTEAIEGLRDVEKALLEDGQ